MTLVLAFGLLAIPIALAFVSPVAMISIVLMSGGIPFPVIAGETISSPFGTINIQAMQLAGMLCGAYVVLLMNMARVQKAITAVPFHACFLLFSLISLTWAPSLGFGFRMLAKLLAPLIFLLCVSVVVDSEKKREKVVSAVLAGGWVTLGVVTAGYVLGQRSTTGFVTLPGLGEAVLSAHMLALSMLPFALFVSGRKAKHGLSFLLFGLVRRIYG